MILVDTCIWIEFFRGTPLYLEGLTHLINKHEVVAIGCVFAELLQGARTEREVQLILQYWRRLPKAIIEDEIWLDAGLLSFQGKCYAKGVGLTDLAIVVVARQNNYTIWTVDKKLQSVLAPVELYQPEKC
ncbi:MAG: PIN domain-containing protein [Myxococcaceae bacterium]